MRRGKFCRRPALQQAKFLARYVLNLPIPAGKTGLAGVFFSFSFHCLLLIRSRCTRVFFFFFFFFCFSCLLAVLSHLAALCLRAAYHFPSPSPIDHPTLMGVFLLLFCFLRHHDPRLLRHVLHGYEYSVSRGGCRFPPLFVRDGSAAVS